MNKPYVTCSDRETNIAEILWLIEAYGIKLEELEPDKAQPRPKEPQPETVVSDS